MKGIVEALRYVLQYHRSRYCRDGTEIGPTEQPKVALLNTPIVDKKEQEDSYME